MEWLLDRNPVLLAFFATIYTWGLTALGSSMVFFFKTINKKRIAKFSEIARNCRQTQTEQK